MQLSSVGRFPRGLLALSLLLSGMGVSQLQPSAVPVNHLVATSTPQPVARTMPIAEFSNGSRIDYVGVYDAEGKFDPMSKFARLYNEAAPPTKGTEPGQPTLRPSEVPAFINLHPRERIVENYVPRAHATKAVKGESRWAEFRDNIVTFAYGHEKALLSPVHVVSDSSGRIVVSDPTARVVHVLAGTGSFRIVGGTNRRVQVPGGIAVDGEDNIYIADSEHGVVVVYDPNGRFLRYIGQLDENESLFHHPTGIAIDKKNRHLLVLDTPRNLLFVLDLNGNVLHRIGKNKSEGNSLELNIPTEITIGNDSIAILDSSALRITILDLDFNPLLQFNTLVASDPATAREMGLGVDSRGDIFLSNSNGSDVRAYDRSGKLLGTFGHLGVDAAGFNTPDGMWIDSSNRMYVADGSNRRVQVLQVTVAPETIALK